MNLTSNEKRDVVKLIEEGKPLPDKYRFLLFDEKREVELVWNGKTNEVCNVVLPFQVIEQVDEPRAEKPGEAQRQTDLFATDARGRQRKGWSNKLIWGDNKLILSSLKNGPLREEIEAQGGLKLIYIDPPFDVGADFSMDIEIGGGTFTKKPGILEEIAYRDTWGKGADSFIAMIYERLVLMRDLLAEDGSIYVHCDWRVNQHIRQILDEVFGSSLFLNEIVWAYFSFKRKTAKKFPQKHDDIISYRKSKDEFIWKTQFRPHSEEYLKRWKTDKSGRKYRDDVNPTAGGTRIIYLDEVEGDIVDSVWDDISPVNPQAKERVDYPTQKPEALLERIIKASSNEGDLVADFFCGSGTVASVAEKLNRKWICTDLGKFAIHTTRKRMIGVQRQLKADDKNYRAFAILNLGKYERQHYIGVNPGLRPEQQQQQIDAKSKEYLQDKGGTEIQGNIKVGAMRPFPVKWQGFVVPKKSVLNRIIGDSSLELKFAEFLENCEDIVSYAKNYYAVNFRLDYVNAAGDVSNYFPDFIVKESENKIVIVETKGREELHLPQKMERLKQWCSDVNEAQSAAYDFVYVDEGSFEKYKQKSFAGLVAGFRAYH